MGKLVKLSNWCIFEFWFLKVVWLSRVNWSLILKHFRQELKLLPSIYTEKDSSLEFILMLGKLKFLCIFTWVSSVLYSLQPLSIHHHSICRVFTCQVRPGSLYHENDDAKLFASWVSLCFLYWMFVQSTSLTWRAFDTLVHCFCIL